MVENQNDAYSTTFTSEWGKRTLSLKRALFLKERTSQILPSPIQTRF